MNNDLMEIPGYLTGTDVEALQAAVDDVLTRQVPGDIVEVGSFHGRSTVVLARALRACGGAHRRILSIDPHEGMLNAMDGRTMMVVDPTLQALRDNLARFGVADLVQVHVGTVDDAPLSTEIALAFVDGLHDAWHVRHDAEALLPHMAPGSLLLFHDYSFNWPDVMTVVNALWQHDERLVWLPVVESLARLQIAERVGR